MIDIDRTLSQDEILPKCTFLCLEFPGNFLGDYGQPPLWQLPNSILASILGTSNWVFRVIPLAASIATTILLMLYLRKRFGAEYALLGLMLLAFFPWQINTSNQVLQTSLLTLFMISSVFFAEKFVEKRKKFDLLAAGVLSAMAMLTMFIAVIAPMAICMYIIFSQSTSITERFRHSLIYCSVTAGLFAAVLAFVHYIYPLALTSSIAHTQDLGGFFKIPVLGLTSLFILFLWFGPISLLFLLVLLTRTKIRSFPADIHLLYLLSSLFIFLVFNSDQSRPFDRYFMVIIPSMIILMINYGRDIFEGLIKEKWLFLTGFALALGALLLLGTIPHPIIPLEPKLEFIQNFLTSLGRVMVPYSSNGGPVGFYVPGLILLASWGICAALFGMSILSRNRRLPVLLISAALACNLCVSLYQAGLMGLPDPNKATSDLIENLEGFPLGEEIFVYRNQGLVGYLPPESAIHLDHIEEIHSRAFQIATFSDVIKDAEDYSVIIVDFPKISDNSRIWAELERCEKVYHSDKFGVDELIFTCSHR
ncbi:MAG: glycosyltransferase family 39 protein [Methanothrix sp.]|nr:glycosyltransferase family 39 protein [Methanothrix sp.]